MGEGALVVWNGRAFILILQAWPFYQAVFWQVATLEERVVKLEAEARAQRWSV